MQRDGGKSILNGVRRSMQYMSAKNGGLLVDFTPITSYAAVAPNEPFFVRVRTVLDWIAFATELGVLDAQRFYRLFDHPEDFQRFAHDLRRDDAMLEVEHIQAFERLALTGGRGYGSAGLADAVLRAAPLTKAA